MPFSCFERSLTLQADQDNFFVITSIFNPASFGSRYQLYHKFAQHMKDTGAQLVTIECIFPSLQQQEFQVTDANNPLHIQLKSESIYWMKENLINIAVSRLPPNAQWICWLDADIHFQNKNWIDKTIKELKKCTVVQMFKKANFLGPQQEVVRTDYSFGYSVVNGKPIDQERYEEWYPHPGYGWAMSLKDFTGINGLPEYDIVGSGDLHFAFSLLNKVSNALESQLNSKFRTLIMGHSNETFKKLHQISKRELKQMVGYVPVNINHYWHGSRKNRQYVERWKILITHDFNFPSDVRKSSNGLFILNPNKPNLQKDILRHFQLRKEDQKSIDVEGQAKKDKIKENKTMFVNPGRSRGGCSSSVRPSVHYHSEEYPCVPGSSNKYFHSGHEYSCDNGGRHYSENYGGTVECTSRY